MSVNYEKSGDNIVVTDAAKGWQITWPDASVNGISPKLAFKEVCYMLDEWEKGANSGKEGFAAILEAIKFAKTVNNTFTLRLASFASCGHPPVELTVKYNATHFGILHPMFASVQFTTEELDKFTIEDETISVSEATIFLKAMQIQDEVFDGSES